MKKFVSESVALASIPLDPPAIGSVPGPIELEPSNIRTVQAALAAAGQAAPVTGAWDPATVTALKGYQTAEGLLVTGDLDAATLERIAAWLVAMQQYNFLIGLVVDAWALATPDLLTAFVDPSGPTGSGPETDANVRWEGMLRVIEVYPSAFANMARLEAALAHQLAVPAPDLAPTTPCPEILDAGAQKHAVNALSARLSDRLAIISLQTAIGGGPGFQRKSATTGPVG